MIINNSDLHSRINNNQTLIEIKNELYIKLFREFKSSFKSENTREFLLIRFFKENNSEVIACKELKLGFTCEEEKFMKINKKVNKELNEKYLEKIFTTEQKLLLNFVDSYTVLKKEANKITQCIINSNIHSNASSTQFIDINAL